MIQGAGNTSFLYEQPAAVATVTIIMTNPVKTNQVFFLPIAMLFNLRMMQKAPLLYFFYYGFVYYYSIRGIIKRGCPGGILGDFPGIPRGYSGDTP
jgi:hypothetical protein